MKCLLSYLLSLLLQLQLSGNSLISRLWLGCRLGSSWQSSQNRDREGGRGVDHAEAGGAQLRQQSPRVLTPPSLGVPISNCRKLATRAVAQTLSITATTPFESQATLHAKQHAKEYAAQLYRCSLLVCCAAVSSSSTGDFCGSH